MLYSTAQYYNFAFDYYRNLLYIYFCKQSFICKIKDLNELRRTAINKLIEIKHKTILLKYLSDFNKITHTCISFLFSLQMHQGRKKELGEYEL